MLTNIQHCICCEDISTDGRNKTSITGFYGIAPNVTLFCNQQLEIKKLSLVFMTGFEGAEEQEVRLSVRVSNKSNNHSFQLPPIPFHIPKTPSRKVLQFAFRLGTVRFPAPDVFNISLFDSERSVYSGFVTVQRGK
jgi:hypothetical protein